MSSSFEKIDYALRPAKHTERRMLCDIFRKLGYFNRLNNYTYVGFGGIAFSDFVLFHKALGIQEMVSIEKSGKLERIEYNKPFNTITLINQAASVALPKLEWKTPHIVWLDYDDKLSNEMFLDAGIIANHALSGCALAISFQCNNAVELDKFKDENEAFNAFISTFTRERIPQKTDVSNLYGWKFATLGTNMLLAEIESILAARNSKLKPEEKLNFKLVCNIGYSDNAKMTTLVGVFVAEKDEESFTKCEFNRLDFVKKVGDTVAIDVPKLTLREIKFLEKQLPLNGKKLNHTAIPTKDAQNFERLYRYLPNFAVLEN